ncbi:unnamed protein product [Pleuronectes platessa]|uniref:Uncharacterized protein n=1 Tax=Pleuronectes platessa TaxID=8262 RepID=A0A9N7U457_PLEPL|nr:unnamed protein product [Pleuronectes platessa]
MKLRGVERAAAEAVDMMPPPQPGYQLHPALCRRSRTGLRLLGRRGDKGSFLTSHGELPGSVLIHLLLVFGVSAAAPSVISALAEVVNSSFEPDGFKPPKGQSVIVTQHDAFSSPPSQ